MPVHLAYSGAWPLPPPPSHESYPSPLAPRDVSDADLVCTFFLYHLGLSNFNPAAFKRYTSDIITSLNLSPSVIYIALFYLAKIRASYPFPLSEIPISSDPFLLLISSFVLATKFLDDNTYTNKTFASFSKYSLDVFNSAEITTLKLLQYNAYISAENYTNWTHWLEMWFWNRTIRPQSRNSTKQRVIPTAIGQNNVVIANNNNSSWCTNAFGFQRHPSPPSYLMTADFTHNLHNALLNASPSNNRSFQAAMQANYSKAHSSAIHPQFSYIPANSLEQIRPVMELTPCSTTLLRSSNIPSQEGFISYPSESLSYSQSIPSTFVGIGLIPGNCQLARDNTVNVPTTQLPPMSQSTTSCSISQVTHLNNQNSSLGNILADAMYSQSLSSSLSSKMNTLETKHQSIDNNFIFENNYAQQYQQTSSSLTSNCHNCIDQSKKGFGFVENSSILQPNVTSRVLQPEEVMLHNKSQLVEEEILYQCFHRNEKPVQVPLSMAHHPDSFLYHQLSHNKSDWKAGDVQPCIWTTTASSTRTRTIANHAPGGWTSLSNPTTHISALNNQQEYPPNLNPPPIEVSCPSSSHPSYPMQYDTGQGHTFNANAIANCLTQAHSNDHLLAKNFCGQTLSSLGDVPANDCIFPDDKTYRWSHYLYGGKLPMTFPRRENVWNQEFYT